MNLDTSVEKLQGIGKYYSFKLKRLNINTLEELIYHFPFRYDDFSKIWGIGEMREITPGDKISVQGVVWQIKNIRTRRGKFVTVATVADQSGTIEVIWFNQPYLTKNIKAGTPISLSGKIELDGTRYKMISPSYEILKNPAVNPDVQAHFTPGVKDTHTPGVGKVNTIHTGRLVPVYPETEGVTSKWLRAKIVNLLPSYLKEQKDFMPKDILARQKLTVLNSALNKIHFPENLKDVETARKRLAFDELFLTQFMAQERKKDWQNRRHAPKMKIDKEKLTVFIKNLPFKLTNAQSRSIKEILTDLNKATPANRLLEGDVGSGKTVVAAAAAYISYLNGFEVLIAAPTEILAFQHEKTLDRLLAPYGIQLGIWTGSKKVRGDITCGTHALLSSFEPQGQVGFVTVDEQHRFGVAQRAKLFLDQSQSQTPHLLTMTATPIPRTLALTLYGDLDLSVLDEMPLGRQKISTFVVPNKKRSDAYKFIEKHVEDGRQAFIITPFVEPSETMATVKAATEEFEKLKKIFSTLDQDNTPGVSQAATLHTPGVKQGKVKLGLLHGRLKSKDKEKIITDFRENKINILVTTPVVEVGIDVPNATVMMIESAERFGLAQLHQLRGRVGRGEHKSYCLLFTQSQAENSIKRLKSMEKVHVGFELAEIDLKMRGPGEVFGLRQSGFTQLKIADLTDEVLISKAQNEAKRLVEDDPQLKNLPLLKEKIKSFQLDFVQPN